MGLGVGLGIGDSVGLAVGLGEGQTDEIGEIVGTAVGGTTVGGIAVGGAGDCVGMSVGLGVGMGLGDGVGLGVGVALAAAEITRRGAVGPSRDEKSKPRALVVTMRTASRFASTDDPAKAVAMSMVTFPAAGAVARFASSAMDCGRWFQERPNWSSWCLLGRR